MYKVMATLIKLIFLFSLGISCLFANAINLTLYENQPNNVFIENSSGKTVSLKPGSTLPDGWTIQSLTEPSVSTIAGSGSTGSTNGTSTVASFNSPRGIAIDTAGNVYVADTLNNKIRKITPSGVVSTFAGTGDLGDGSSDGVGVYASFAYPEGMAIDSAGTLYVSDGLTGGIRKITPSGVVTTLAGCGSDEPGSQDGIGTSASFSYPKGVALDSAGNVYVADTSNHKIRKITPSGVVSTLAGSGSYGSKDGVGTLASFYYPSGVAVDKAGNVYVADTYNQKIRKITPNGVVSTFAGSGYEGKFDAEGLAASFSYPEGMTLGNDGNLYVADSRNGLIRKISPDGNVSTLKKSGTSVLFSSPSAITFDKDGSFYVTDTSNNKIKKIIQSYSEFQGSIHTPGTYSFTLLISNGATIMEQNYSLTVLEVNDTPIISSLSDVTLTESNKNPTIPFTVQDDEINASELSITASSSDESVIPLSNIILGGSGSNRTLTLSPSNKNGQSNITLTLSDGIKSTSLTFKVNVKVNTTVNAQIGNSTNYSVLIPHFNNSTKVSLKPDSTLPTGLTLQSFTELIVSTLSGSGTFGSSDGNGTSASFGSPEGIAIGEDGNIYVADTKNNKIRKITSTGMVSTLAGSLCGSKDGIIAIASFCLPSGLTVDNIGNVYVADSYNNKIRKISRTGRVITLAGSGSYGSSDGNMTSASFNNPQGITIGQDGNIYVADTKNDKIRKITPAGMVSTFADGKGFSYPKGIAIDQDENIYGADTLYNKIRKITPAGMISTLAGDDSGSYGSTDGNGTSASFNSPEGIAIGQDGNIYVADTKNNKIRKITPAGMVSTLAGSGSYGSTDGNGTSASFNSPEGIAVDSVGNIYIADTSNHKIRKIVQPHSELKGTMTTPGIYSFTLLINDGTTTVEQSYSLTVLETSQTTSLQLDNNWNLISLPVDTTLQQDTFDSKFGDDAIIWAFDKNNSKPWSIHVGSELSSISIPQTIGNITALVPAQGFWVLSNGARTVAFDGNTTYDFTTKVDITQLTMGWHLLGTGTDKAVKDLNNSHISSIWKYKNGVWETTLTGAFSSGIPSMSEVKAGEGFWILIK